MLGVEQPDGGYWLPLFVRLDAGVELDDALVERITGARARARLAAPRPRRGRRRARGPAHDDGQEAGGAAQAHRAGRPARAGAQPRLDRRPAGGRAGSSSTCVARRPTRQDDRAEPLDPGAHMQQRTLGSLTVSALGLGCMGMSEFYGPGDEQESLATIAPGPRPRLHLPRHRRHVRPLHQRAARRPGDRRAGATRSCWPRSSATSAAPTARGIGINGRPEYVRARLRRVAAAPRRRRHRPLLPAPGRPRHARRGHLGRAWPSSCRPARSATSASPRPRPPRSAGRTPSTRSRRCRPSGRCGRATPRTSCCPLVRELGIGFVPYSPLGRGFLTGQFSRPEDIPEDDFRRHNPRFQGENFTRNLQLVDRVKQLADEKGCTPAQLALAWLLHQGDDVAPIPGTKKRSAARGEPRRGRRLAERRRPRPARRAGAGRRGRRRPVSRHEQRQPLSRAVPPRPAAGLGDRPGGARAVRLAGRGARRPPASSARPTTPATTGGTSCWSPTRAASGTPGAGSAAFRAAFPHADWLAFGLVVAPADDGAWRALGLEVEVDEVLDHVDRPRQPALAGRVHRAPLAGTGLGRPPSAGAVRGDAGGEDPAARTRPSCAGAAPPAGRCRRRTRRPSSAPSCDGGLVSRARRRALRHDRALLERRHRRGAPAARARLPPARRRRGSGRRSAAATAG